jgi:hypothetical protein
VVLAALGGPVDSLRAQEQRMVRILESDVPASSRPLLRGAFLGRPATLAFPAYRFAPVNAGVATPPLALAQSAFARGDTAEVRRILSRVRDTRRASRPGDFTLDALYPEAWLLAAIGDERQAAAWLDPTLEALGSSTPGAFDDPARAASLVQAMALRADLAVRLGDTTTARKWATMVAMLWSDADSFLKPTVVRMARLSR